ncbi:ATP-dependent rRNA helicase [Fasciolopsis buskii]|uniref:RNA helicase n=1 Tax=Fasciolopsis buskii TaxID=27845 RepID=A0A8E0RPZ8_9TREM|nr:ATP-dependent rRNA helicase [Fasciolopsis buski]
MSFAQLGVCKEILDVIEKLGWEKPSEIQSKAIPPSLRGRDIVGLAETGSGKTAAFAIPILQDLISKPRHNFALILTPTRELALQLKSQFLDLGEVYGLRVICLVGGQHVEDQLRDLKNNKFHVIIGTPGRIVYHLENSKDLRLNRVRYLVLDEADQMLEETFENHLKTIVSRIPESRRTYLYSATMSQKVCKIQSVCSKSPITVQVSTKYAKVERLDHAFVFLPDQERDMYLVYLLSCAASKTTDTSRSIVFTTTWRESFRIAGLLKLLGPLAGGIATPLNGAMQQEKRQNALFEFRSGKINILVATDLASRGLDIPDVDLVINYDVPKRPSWSDSAKAYIHRVGRTARAGRPGRAVTLVTPYSASRLKAIEAALGERVPQLPWPGLSCLSSELRGRVHLADKQSRANLREKDKKKRISNKKRQKQKERRAEAFADPVDFGNSDRDSED